MNVVAFLFIMSALVSFIAGPFHWYSILAISVVVAFVSVGSLTRYGFDAVHGIAIVFGCLTVSQVSYLLGAYCKRQIESEL